jgi:membrane-associated phospholipid phosphatase
MRVILVVDLVLLGSLVASGLSFLLSSRYWRLWVLRVCAVLGGLAALLWIADASGMIRLPRPYDAPPPLSNLPDHSLAPAVTSAPIIHSKVQHQNILEERKKALESNTPKSQP